MQEGRWIGMGALAAALVFAACAGQRPVEDGMPAADAAQAGSRAYQLGQVEVAPVLLGCPHNEPARATSGHGDKVTVQYVVGPDGKVESGSVAVRRRHHDSDDQALIERAMQVARACTYQPGEIAGEPVRVAVTKRFTFEPSR